MTCHLHNESRLTTHTGITPLHPSRPWPKPSPTPHLHHPHHRNPYADTRPLLPLLLQDWKSPNPILFIYSPHHLPHCPEPNTHTFLTLHQLLSSHAQHSSSLAGQLRYTQYLNHVYHPHTHSRTPRNLTFPVSHTSISITLVLSQHTDIQHIKNRTRITGPQPPHAPHRMPRQPHRQTKDNYMITHTTQAYRPSSKSEINLIKLQVNINEIKNKIDELKLLIRNTHTDIITLQGTKLIPKAKTAKVHNFTTVHTYIHILYRSHKTGDGIITLVRDNITLTTTYMPLIHTTHNFNGQGTY